MKRLERLTLKLCIALHVKPISELRGVTCHMGSHSVTRHPTQVNALRLVSGRHSEGPPFSAISSCDDLRLGIRLALGLGSGSVVWLWQYQELFPATTMNDGFQNGRPFGMADRNPRLNHSQTDLPTPEGWKAELT